MTYTVHLSRVSATHPRTVQRVSVYLDAPDAKAARHLACSFRGLTWRAVGVARGIDPWAFAMSDGVRS